MKHLTKCEICNKQMETAHDHTGAKVFHGECAAKKVQAGFTAEEMAQAQKAKDFLNKECPHV